MAVLDGSDGNKDGAIDDALINDDVGSGLYFLWDNNTDYISDYMDIVESLPSLSMDDYFTNPVRFDHYYDNTINAYGSYEDIGYGPILWV